MNDDDFSYSDWFSCPMCGDEGDVQVAVAGTNYGDVEFTCLSDEHRLEKHNFRRFNPIEVRRLDSEGLFDRIVGRLGMVDDKFGGRMSACLSCPYCDSNSCEGALELFRTQIGNDYVTGVILTVWCLDCRSSEQISVVNNSKVSSSDVDVQSISSFPPKYVR